MESEKTYPGSNGNFSSVETRYLYLFLWKWTARSLAEILISDRESQNPVLCEGFYDSSL